MSDAADRQRAARAWSDIALAEHASVASFARVVMELVSIGAPPGLLERAAAAIGDEVRHARKAFAIASDLHGRPVGPSELAVAGAMIEQPDLTEIALSTLSDGCIEEGVAAAQARVAAKECPGFASDFWRLIAEEEQSHAELAWDCLEFMIAQAPQLLHPLKSRMEAALRSSSPEAPPDDLDGLQAYGLLPRKRLAAVARATVTETIAPRGRLMFASGSDTALISVHG